MKTIVVYKFISLEIYTMNEKEEIKEKSTVLPGCCVGVSSSSDSRLLLNAVGDGNNLRDSGKLFQKNAPLCLTVKCLIHEVFDR
jgi:hypothetical protein